MSLSWKILFIILLIMVSCLLYRDLTFVNSQPDLVSFAVYTNEVEVLRSTLLSLSNGSERLKSDYVNLSNYVHGLGVKHNGNVRINSAPNNGFQGQNELKSMQKDSYIRGSYVYSCVGLDKYLYFNGSLLRVGMPSEFGRVIVIDKYFTVCISDDHSTTYLLPYNKEHDSRLPFARSTSSADGKREIGSGYYVHTGTDMPE